MSIRELALWQKAISTENIAARRVIEDGLLEQLPADGIHELLSIVEEGTADERESAARMISRLVDTADPRIGSDEKGRWLEVARRILPLEYPRSVPGRIAFRALFLADLPTAEHFLVREF